jgi:hypothetical protein
MAERMKPRGMVRSVDPVPRQSADDTSHQEDHGHERSLNDSMPG